MNLYQDDEEKMVEEKQESCCIQETAPIQQPEECQSEESKSEE